MKNTRKKTAILMAVMILAIAGLGAAKLPGLYREISFYWQERSEAELKVKKYAEEVGVSYAAYPRSLIELLERNPETEAFVLNYPFRKKEKIILPAPDPEEGVPLYMQWDTRWGYRRYGSDVAGITGCGPLCLSMVGHYVTGSEDFSPEKMLDFAARNGYYSPGNGSSWTLISEGGVKLGLQVTEIPLVEKRIMDNLEAGNPIICAMGAGDFTASGHYIVLSGVEDGLLRVNDPNSYENSDKLWSYSDIESQIRNLWVIR